MLAVAMLVWAVSMPVLCASIPSQEQQQIVNEPAGRRTESPEVFDHVLVTGGPGEVEAIPGAAIFIDRQELERQSYTDVHRVLRRVPGVNIQEEDGYGLRPNIGMRGTGVERSRKITLLEDGVLIAPAPYAAPAAYYVPTAGRMEAMEVRKGSAAVSQGPYTTGGVINFVSTAIPAELAARVRLSYGSEETLRLHANTGGSSQRWGWLLEAFHLDTDGFKELDGGGPTGVRLEDYVAKLRFSSGESSARDYWLELKLGKAGQFGEETYLGLTQTDFDRTPYRRYAGSQQDWIDTDHEQFQLRLFVQTDPRVRITATAYRNDFSRNWHKLQSVTGVAISDVLEEAELFQDELAILRGEVDSDIGGLAIRNNRRGYRAEGIDTLLEWHLPASKWEQRLQFGFRFHEDEEARFQEEEQWNMVGGRMALEHRGRPGSQSNRIDGADAKALFLSDSISFGDWTLSPGVRFESIEFQRRDYGRSDPQRSGQSVVIRTNSVDEVMPGLGIARSLSPRSSLFGGVHRGFAPPGPGQDAQTDAETSWNYEFGWRYRQKTTAASAVAFFSDYDNLLGRDTLSAGGEGSGDAFNGGKVEVVGLESAVQYDLGRARSWRLGVPLSLVYTYTEGKFQSSFETGFADWAPRVQGGDEMPYLPPHQLAVGLGIVAERWGLYVDLAYTDAMRTSPGSGPIPSSEGTDENLVVDLSLGYQLHPRLRLQLQARNLADEVYVVARRPAGARPGRPRAVLLGFDWEL